jgi:hypothetical protein
VTLPLRFFLHYHGANKYNGDESMARSLQYLSSLIAAALPLYILLVVCTVMLVVRCASPVTSFILYC